MLKPPILAAATLLFAALPPAGAAGPAPLGAKARASSCATCSQTTPSVAGLASGEFMIGWEGESGTDAKGVVGRLFKNTGLPKAVDFQINKGVVPPEQFDVAVAGDATGYVAAWSSVLNANSDIFVQRYSVAGVPQGTPILINVDGSTLPHYADFNPAVARTAGGGFVIAWIRFLPPGTTTPGTDPEILLRRFNSSGVALGAPVKLNTRLVNGDRPDLCVDSTGQIDVAWTSADGFPLFQPNHKGVSLRRVSAAGAPVGAEVVVAPPLASNAQMNISCGLAGNFVIVWESDQPPATARFDILGARYNKNGVRTGAVFRVNSVTTENQRNPAVSHDSKGNFVVVWEHNLVSGGAINARRFSVAGVATGPDFAVDTYPPGNPRSIEPEIAHVGTAGNFVVAFQDGLQGVWMRRFTPGTPFLTQTAADEPVAETVADEPEE
ncbi:MAG TPA: hypothetical protein VGS22_03375 [Thermoanaerobaculia bacterium]|jgi:hypothetical protein|nr:hypothetical protein [Thermoanaerobaculia bacterium]